LRLNRRRIAQPRRDDLLEVLAAVAVIQSGRISEHSFAIGKPALRLDLVSALPYKWAHPLSPAPQLHDPRLVTITAQYDLYPRNETANRAVKQNKQPWMNATLHRADTTVSVRSAPPQQQLG